MPQVQVTQGAPASPPPRAQGARRAPIRLLCTSGAPPHASAPSAAAAPAWCSWRARASAAYVKTRRAPPRQAFFTPVTVEIAGFKDNQSYGLGAAPRDAPRAAASSRRLATQPAAPLRSRRALAGTNSWTEAQKGNAIFGGLGFCFVLLMSGYALN